MRRLTFVVRKGIIELLAEQEVDMTALPSALPHPDVRASFWYELQDAQGKAVSKHAAPDPLVSHLEVFSDDPARSIARVPDQRQEHAFSVVLPSTAAEHVVLMRATPASPALHASTASRAVSATGEVARFKLSK